MLRREGREWWSRDAGSLVQEIVNRVSLPHLVGYVRVAEIAFTLPFPLFPCSCNRLALELPGLFALPTGNPAGSQPPWAFDPMSLNPTDHKLLLVIHMASLSPKETAH